MSRQMADKNAGGIWKTLNASHWVAVAVVADIGTWLAKFPKLTGNIDKSGNNDSIRFDSLGLMTSH